MLSRLYWYMVEFGLIHTRAGLRVYGAGILSSKGETVYSIESDVPQRLRFDLTRVMRTEYRIDEFQQTYFVLDSFEQLFHACYGTDFAPLYARHAAQAPIGADAHVPEDVPVPRRRSSTTSTATPTATGTWRAGATACMATAARRATPAPIRLNHARRRSQRWSITGRLTEAAHNPAPLAPPVARLQMSGYAS